MGLKSKKLAASSGYKKLAGLVMLLVLIIPASASAVTTLSQGYTSKDSLAIGSLVSLDNNSSDNVSAANTSNVNNLLGVVIDSGNSLLSLSSSQAKQVQVATSGVEQVLVSDINGQIEKGDEITASPIAGVGMKATSNVKVIGAAQANLQGGKQTYKDKNGQQHSANIGSVPINVGITYYYVQPDKTIIPSAFQNVANSLAGKPVNALPIIVSGAIFLIMIIVVASIIYSMIRSSIISVGRNPMSQSAIYRDMVQMSALVVGIIAVAVVAIYMILTKL